MADGVRSVSGLADNPLDAAAEFFARHVPEIREAMRGLDGCALSLVFEPAGHEHRAWRLAAGDRLQHICLETQQQTGIAREHSAASNPDGKPIGGK